ncbi:MAG: hypothetical protein R3C03_23720 [Pirellulaceae bacterium]
MVSNTQQIDDPFGENSPQFAQDAPPAPRVSQTLAAPQTRPQATMNLPQQSAEQSVLGMGDEQVFDLIGEGPTDVDSGIMLPQSPVETHRNEMVPNRFRNTSSPRRLVVQEEGDEDDRNRSVDEPFRDCDTFRHELLNYSITSIALDISPPPDLKQGDTGSLYRDWTDLSGNIVASGTMVDLRRGYVIIQSNQGSLQKIAFARLNESDVAAVASAWKIPSACFASRGYFAGRCWQPQTVTWYASNLCHKPLYFENVQLERYGHSAGPVMGPVRAAAHFFGSVAFFPYHTAINPPNECQYALGYYRPGNCAPWLVDPFPISREGALRQTSVISGLWYAF